MSRIMVPLARTVVDPSEILADAPVLAPTQWSDVAAGALWLRGRGAQLVPWHSPVYEIKDATEQIFRYRVKPRMPALERVWAVALVIEPAAGEADSCQVLVRAPAVTGTTFRGGASRYRLPIQIVECVETLSAQSETEAEISIGIRCYTDVAGAVMDTTAYVVGIGCWERDRPTLDDDTTDLAVRTETIRPGEPVLRVDRTSLWGAMQLVAGSDARRVGIFHWANGAAVSRLSAVAANLFTIPPKVQAPKLTRSTTTTAVKWAARARSTTGASVTVAISTSASGVSDSVGITTTTMGWTTARTVSIGCDDTSVSDLFRDDELTITIAGSGVASIEIDAFAMWVDDVT